MDSFDSDKQCLLKDVLLDNLKMLGVRCRIPKKIKENEKENFPEHQIFQKPLHMLKMRSVPRQNGTLVEVPEFLVDVCEVIERGIKMEGIFRRAGSTCKQRESKMLIDQGVKVKSDCHVFDACSLVKLFFRELPQPLIPYNYHDIFLSCLFLSNEQHQLEALLLACLLLPVENLKTLAFFMEILHKVSKYSDANLMTEKNLAIILTPTLMPAQKRGSSVDLTNHFKIIEILIQNSEKIGVIPENIAEVANNAKIKKKKRSSSLTRMFTGLKKMVGTKNSSTPDRDESGFSTPGSVSSASKRKSSDHIVSGLLAKKKRIVPDGALVATPLRCRMHGYVTPGFTGRESVVPTNLKKAESVSPPSNKSRRNHNRSGSERENKTSTSKLVQKCLTKKQRSVSSVTSSSSIGNLFHLGSSKASSDRRLNKIRWGRKRSLSNLFLNKSGESYPDPDLSDTRLSSDDSELITVPKSEYEDIKNRVTALEEEIEVLNAVHSVETAYEKILEESAKINSGSTEQLARRLSKELKIRLSDEAKVIRSPSARRIGSIRRRSKESLQRSVENKTSLRRGRPNTVQSGLPSRGTRRTPGTPVDEDGNVRVWQGRPSVAEIRFQNAGMVMEKAKLFNALEAEERRATAIQRRHSTRLEMLRRQREMDERKQLTRTNTIGAGSGKSCVRDKTLSRSGSSQSMTSSVSRKRSIGAESGTRPSPVIKQALNPRSPSSTFGKTPASLLKSAATTASRSRATPIRVLTDPYGTPRVGVRRSPRILARTLTVSPRLNA